jgi:hypothetical protein
MNTRQGSKLEEVGFDYHGTPKRGSMVTVNKAFRLPDAHSKKRKSILCHSISKLVYRKFKHRCFFYTLNSGPNSLPKLWVKKAILKYDLIFLAMVIMVIRALKKTWILVSSIRSRPAMQKSFQQPVITNRQDNCTA